MIAAESGFGAGGKQHGDFSDTAAARELRLRMVDEQLAERGITDARVLAAMRAVPRHWFCLPGTAEDMAYGDYPLPIGYGQTISQPLMVADMLQQMHLTGGETVLEVGTGSGYNAALLSRLAHRVVTLEIVPELAAAARIRLHGGGFDNVEVYHADGSKGWPAAAPYDAIVVTAGAPAVPEQLREQLGMGGRLVIPVGSMALQTLLVVQRTGKGFRYTELEQCRFVPLQGESGWQWTDRFT